MAGLEERLHAHEPLFGSWYLRGEIGYGSYGRVYRVESQDKFRISSVAALKAIEIRPDSRIVSSPEKLKRLIFEETMSEVEALKQLRGLSNVVNMDDHTVLEIIEDGRLVGYDLLIRMELLQNAHSYFQKDVRRELAAAEAKRLGKDICRGLIRCHSLDILHRDINPKNIFRNAFGDFKLGDFGIAKQLDGTLHAKTAIGTRRYVAPEVWNKKNGTVQTDNYDARADIYCLGLVLYEIANDGFLPFFYEGLSGMQLEDAINRRLDGEALTPPCLADEAFSQVILKACAFQPKDRYADAQEMYAALCALERPEPQESEPRLPIKQADFWHPEKNLLSAAGLSVIATPEMRYIAEKLDDHMREEQKDEPGGVLTARAAARLPEWRIRKPWFPFNSLTLRRHAAIADRAFFGRRDIVSLHTGGYVSEIGEEAFSRCGSLTEVFCEDGIRRIAKRAFAEDGKLTRCQIAASVKEIEEQAFRDCSALSSLRLSDQLQQIADAMCEGCTSLHQITLPTELRSIGEDAFRSSGLQKILLPDSCIRLGAGAFSDCKRLNSVQISLRLAIIPEECFAGCTSLTQFDFPFRLAEIRDRAFFGCSSLTNIVIPEGVRRIGAQAFARCDSLQTVRIPDSVRQIGEHAFLGKAKRRFSNLKLTVIANRDSYAWQYCYHNGIRVREPQ